MIYKQSRKLHDQKKHALDMLCAEEQVKFEVKMIDLLFQQTITAGSLTQKNESKPKL